MSIIDKRVLREAAVRAGGVKWQYMRATQHSKAYITDDKGSTVVNCTDGDVPAKCAGFLESANPAAVLALLDELEAKDKLNAELMEKQRLINICQGQGLEHRIATEKRAEAAEKRIAELEELEELFLRAKALMHQSGGTPIKSSLNPVDAWLYEAENATAGKGE